MIQQDGAERRSVVGSIPQGVLPYSISDKPNKMAVAKTCLEWGKAWQGDGTALWLLKAEPKLNENSPLQVPWGALSCLTWQG